MLMKWGGLWQSRGQVSRRHAGFTLFLQLIHLREGQWVMHQEKGWHWLMHFSCFSPPWQLGMQSVRHGCRCALWTCVEDCRDGSLGTSSDSHALLLNEGQWLLLTLGAFWSCQERHKRKGKKNCKSHQDSAEYVRVKLNKSASFTTFKLCTSDSTELCITRVQHFDNIYTRYINTKQDTNGLKNK